MDRESMKRILGDKPIGYHPIIAKCLKSATGALFFSQLMYWDSTLKEHRDGWFWKTHSEMTDETGLTRSEQDTARRELKARGWIKEVRKGIPARLWYHVEWDKFFDDIAAYKNEPIPQSSTQNPAIKSDKIPQSITESTPESTTENGDAKTASQSPAEKQFDAMPSASEGMVPLQVLDSAIATPRDSKASYKKTVGAWFADVLSHQYPTASDKAAAGECFEMHFPIGRLLEFCRFKEGKYITNGKEPNAYWIKNDFDEWRAKQYPPLMLRKLIEVTL